MVTAGSIVLFQHGGLALAMPWRAWEHSRGCEGDSVAELRLALIIGVGRFPASASRRAVPGIRFRRKVGYSVSRLSAIVIPYPAGDFSRRGGRALRPSSSYP